MHINDKAIIATSYIAKDGDEKNKCFLSKEYLFVKYKGRLDSFELESIKGIFFKHKMMLFPLVAGGILTPLFLLAVFKTDANPWLLLSGMVAGLLLIYYGYEGTPTLSILTKVKEYDFFIKKPTPNLFAFAKYTRQIFTLGERGALFYLQLSDHEKETLETTGSVLFSKPAQLFYFEEVLHKKEASTYFAIDPLSVPNNFKLVDIDNKLHPQLEGEIAKEYILSVDS